MYSLEIDPHNDPRSPIVCTRSMIENVTHPARFYLTPKVLAIMRTSIRKIILHVTVSFIFQLLTLYSAA